MPARCLAVFLLLATLSFAASGPLRTQISPAIRTMVSNTTQQLSAKGDFLSITGAGGKDLTSIATWRSSNPGIATVNAGLVTSVASGTVAIYADAGPFHGSTTITVVPNLPVSSVAVTPANPSVPNGLTQQFTATATYSDNSTQDVTAAATWTSNTPSVATINSLGLARTHAQGPTTISASFTGAGNSSTSSSTTLTVVAPLLVSILVQPSNPNVVAGAGQSFTATGIYTDSSTQDITNTVAWSSSNTGIATIDSSGHAATLVQGETTISAMLNAVTGSTLLTVLPRPKVISMNVLLFPGASGDPHYGDIASVLYNNSTVTGATIAVEWSSADNGTGTYDWTYADTQIQPWVNAGKKANLVFWANADSSSSICNSAGQFGQNGTGNCAIPAYVWTALSSANYTQCTSQYGTQQIPNYFASAFQNNYRNFISAAVQRYGSNSHVGYIRFGLGHGGETLPVAGWNNTSTACGQAFVSTWGYTVSNWENYLQTMLNYEGSLNSPRQLMVGITPMGVPNTQVPDFIAPVAVPNHIGFGSQGLEHSDVTNYPNCTADWCNLFNQYTGQIPLELQTLGQSCPTGSSGCTTQQQQTGDLTELLPFAVSHHTTIFEIYFQDWLVAYDPNYPGNAQYGAGYQQALQNAVTGK